MAAGRALLQNFKLLGNLASKSILVSSRISKYHFYSLKSNPSSLMTIVRQRFPHVRQCSMCNSSGVNCLDKEEPKPERRNIDVENALADVGISMRKIRRQVNVKRLSLEKVNETILFLKELGLTKRDVSNVLRKRPSIMLMKSELLKSRVDAMKNVGIEPSAVAFAVKSSPGVLTAKTEETLPVKIEYLLELKVKPRLTKEEVLHILTKCPDLMATCSLETMQRKMEFFENELKFTRQHLRNILVKQPSVLTFSTESMKTKYEYCYEKLNAGRSSIVRCPRMFTCSLQRIKERHQFLLHVGRLKEGLVLDDYGLGVITTNTDKYFAEKVASSTLQVFEEFKRSLSEKSAEE